MDNQNQRVTEQASTDEQSNVLPPFAATAGLLNANELAAFRRFDECAQDGEGYDVPKEMMQRLAEIGVVRRKSGAYYEHTEYGLSVLDRSHQIDIGTLVNRFLGWPLPEGLRPGIERPIGTHLMNADQARAMLEYVLASRCRAPAPSKEAAPLDVRAALQLMVDRFGPCEDRYIFSKRLAIQKARAALAQPGAAQAAHAGADTERDAARYRYLRHKREPIPMSWTLDIPDGAALDDALDSLIAASQPQKGSQA